MVLVTQESIMIDAINAAAKAAPEATRERGTRLGAARGTILSLAPTAGTGLKADVQFPAPLGVVKGVYISKSRIESDGLAVGSEEDFEAFRMADGSMDIRVKSTRDPDAIAAVFQ